MRALHDAEERMVFKNAIFYNFSSTIKSAWNNKTMVI